MAKREHDGYGRCHPRLLSATAMGAANPVAAGDDAVDVFASRAFAMRKTTLWQDALSYDVAQAAFRSRLFSLALRRIWVVKLIEASMGNTPRKVRSDGAAPCR